MTCNTSDAAFFCSSASFSSLVSRATFVSRLAMRTARAPSLWRNAALRAAVFRRCAFAPRHLLWNALALPPLGSGQAHLG